MTPVGKGEEAMGRVDLERLKLLRKQKGLTQEDVAFQLGYKTRTGYHRLEKGSRSIRADQLAKLAILFNVPMEDLMERGDGLNETG